MFTAFTPSHRGGAGSPLVCLHGFTGTWRMWELVLPLLERHRDVLAPTLLGHAGGPGTDGDASAEAVVDAVELAMDEAGFETADIVGNSLGGYVALKLATRGRARSVVALAPAGGWAEGDDSYNEVLDWFERQQPQLKQAAPYADEIAANRWGRRQATEFIVVNYKHIPPDLIAHMIASGANCPAAEAMIELARRDGWPLEPELIRCPVRVVWGTEDKLLAWPRSAERFRHDWLPNADWVVLDGIGHCPQLDVPLETAELILGFTDR
jgi:pimeloyl-ACP methyl ester carboxylesterase